MWFVPQQVLDVTSRDQLANWPGNGLIFAHQIISDGGSQSTLDSTLHCIHHHHAYESVHLLDALVSMHSSPFAIASNIPWKQMGTKQAIQFVVTAKMLKKFMNIVEWQAGSQDKLMLSNAIQQFAFFSLRISLLLRRKQSKRTIRDLGKIEMHRIEEKEDKAWRSVLKGRAWHPLGRHCHQKRQQ